MSKYSAEGARLSETLRRILTEAVRGLAADRGAIFLRDAGSDSVRCEASVGLSESYRNAAAHQWPSYQDAFAGGAPGVLFWKDARTASPYAVVKNEVISEGFRSALNVPLLSEGALLDFLGLYFDQTCEVTGEETSGLLMAAEFAALAIENTRTCEALRTRSERQEALRKVTQQLTRNIDPQVLFRRICQSVLDLLDVGFVHFLILNPVTKGLDVAAASGDLEHDELASRRFPQGKGLSSRVFARKEPVMVREVLEDPDWMDREWAGRDHIKSFLGIPLRLEGEVVGVLDCFTREIREFRPDEIELMQDFADQAAVAFGNALLYAETKSRTTNLEVLDEILKVVNSTLDLGEVFRITAEQVKRAVPCERCSLYKLDSDKKFIAEFYVADDDQDRGRWINRLRKNSDGLVFWSRFGPCALSFRTR